ncbi:MAG: hemolysin III family protein [Candidatus Cloacimonetes bacterium]|jgi:hemolysin III|nr:hemolysin III family protein [Candidatus Cloacimonadota bacterium]
MSKNKLDETEIMTSDEEIANAVLHGIGLGLSIAVLVALVVLGRIHGDILYIVSFSVYGSTLILLYLSSTLYHSFPHGKVKDIFEIFDHSAIYLLIAGTYTPISLIAIKGSFGWTMFGIIWGVAICGILFKVFWIKKFVLLSTVFYIIMGCFIIIAIKPIFANMNTTSIVFLFIGGASYILGTIFYLWRKIKYHHAIWHLFVLGGSTCHFFTMFFLISK